MLKKCGSIDISIHAPRVGSDFWMVFRVSQPCYFNPRSPCGERHGDDCAALDGFQFQSTLPVWGATLVFRMTFRILAISIHAPRVGSDPGTSGVL